MNFKKLLLERLAEDAYLRKAAAAILTPEAEQAAVQGGMGPDPAMGGAPMDPAMAQGGAPMDPSMMGGAPTGAPQGSGGGQLPPEIMQDPGFIQWLQQQGVMFDPQSGMFMDQTGQPLPAEAIMQAYQAYQQEMMAAQGGAPMDPSMMGGAPMDPAMAQGGAPMDPSMMGGAPMDPSMMVGAPMDPSMGGGLPPEVLQDQQFAQFMAEAVGAQFDPNQGMYMDPSTGQPLPPDMVMQAYDAYQQQMGGSGGMPPEAGGSPEAGGTPAADNQIPPEVMEQLQSAIDSSIENFTAQLDKKIETLLDKLETVKMALESMKDTDDARSAQDREHDKELQDELAEELNPTVKSASEQPAPAPTPAQPAPQRQPMQAINMYDFIINRKH